jgi:hypothetical protein
MSRVFISLLLLSSTLYTSSATSQAPDVLIYDNKIYDLFANPLESFYTKRNNRPPFRIRPDVMGSSSNWRGYVATWEIKDEVLYLRAIDAWICDSDEYVTDKCKKADLREIFGESCLKGKVRATRFSGHLRIPDGKLLHYVHMGYGSVYEREIILAVESGKVIGKTAVDNTKRQLPSDLELQRQELEKLKHSETGTRRND